MLERAVWKGRNMRLRTWLSAGVLVGVGLGAVARGEPLNPARILPDARWVVHVDVEAWARSAVARSLPAVAWPEQVRRCWNGRDPLRELRAITVFGGSPAPSEAVVVVVASSAIDDLARRLSEDEGLIQRTGEGFDAVYTWVERGMVRCGVVRAGRTPDERIVVVAGQPEQMWETVHRIEGRAVDGGQRAKVLETGPQPGSFLFAAWGPMPGGERGVVLRHARRVVCDAGEQEGVVYAHVRAMLSDEHQAHASAQALRGMVALMRLRAMEEPGLEALAALTDRVRIEVSGPALGASLDVPVERLAAIVGSVQAAMASERRDTPGDRRDVPVSRRERSSESGEALASDVESAPRRR